MYSIRFIYYCTNTSEWNTLSSKDQKHISSSIFFPPLKIVLFMRNMVQPCTPLITIRRMRFGCQITKLIVTHTEYLTYCFPTATRVTRTRRNVALYYTLITNLMHWLLFIHKILFSSICFEHQVLIFRRTQLYTCSIWYCHSVNRWVVEYY